MDIVNDEQNKLAQKNKEFNSNTKLRTLTNFIKKDWTS